MDQPGIGDVFRGGPGLALKRGGAGGKGIENPARIRGGAAEAVVMAGDEDFGGGAGREGFRDGLDILPRGLQAEDGAVGVGRVAGLVQADPCGADPPVQAHKFSMAKPGGHGAASSGSGKSSRSA